MEHKKKRMPGPRLQAASLAGGLVLLLSAGIGIASAGQNDNGQQSSSAKGLYTPQLDAKRARQGAIAHLMSIGVPRDEATLRIQKQAGQVRAAVALRKKAPESVQSVWIDGNGTLRASVLNKAGEQAAHAAGATPKLVAFSTKDLEAAQDTLAQDVKDNPPPGFRGASFEIDPAKGKVIAQYMFDGANPVVPTAATRLGNIVNASAETGGLATQEDVGIAGASMAGVTEGKGGPFITNCTAAWAVDIADPNGGVPGNGVMTAGHCFDVDDDPQKTEYDIDTTAAGNTQAKGEFFTFGAAGDYGYLRLQRDRGTTVMPNSGNVVEAIEEPVVGATVCKDGAETGETCGQIKRVGVTLITRHGDVNFLVKGMVRTDYCAIVGDSGAPVYMDFDQAKGPLGIAALGVHSSGITTIKGPCEAYFTPLSDIDPQGKFFVRIDGG
ncbi:S1 family peptidase [Streptomyces sp. NPDC005799]|uniref:S1 family peptidase n=1 Tax=Streptomyces sp. NPDC005799 TaxID=3154678 RepID=UPI0033D1B5E4